MRSAVTIVDSLSTTLLNFTELGDPVTRMTLDNVTVEVAKTTAADVSNSTISAQQGSLDLPDMTSVVDDVDSETTCVQRSVFFASFNPHMYVESASDVSSNTVRFFLESCNNGTDVMSGETAGPRNARYSGKWQSCHNQYLYRCVDAQCCIYVQLCCRQ